MKKGISMLILVVAISVMTLLISSTIIVGSNSIKTANYQEFLSQLNRTYDSVNDYYIKNYKLPITGELISAGSLGDEFIEEISKRNDLQNKLYIVDVSLLNDSTIKKGRGDMNDKDLFVVAENTNNIYYIKGYKYKGKVHFTLELEEN